MRRNVKHSNKRSLNVLYQSDDNYAMVSGISIVSLLENNQHLDEVVVYYCEYNVSKENKERLRKLCSGYQNSTIKFLDGKVYHNELMELNVKPWHGVYVTWLKLLAFRDVDIVSDRIVFINGHTIINSALDYLIDYDFKDNVMALSYDCLTNTHKKTIGLGEADGYFNCGIMLINHEVWMRQKISETIKEHLREKSDYVIADQDLCNVMFKGKIGLMDCTYNFSSAYYAYDLKKLLRTNDLKDEYFYSYESIMEAYYAPKIIHSLFGIKGKPWEVGSEHPQRYLWNRYLNMTPWKDMERKAAKRSLTWHLYDVLPSGLFMLIYGMSVRKKFGSKEA